MKPCSEKIYCRYIKRILDIILSFALLFFLLLPMFLIAVAIRSDSKGKAIFKQKRMGRGGKIFVCYKFRSMYIDTPPERPASRFGESDKYVTRVGRFLRRTSLDELPQLFNVLKGDMSLIGPRPLICGEGDIHKKRMDVGVYNIRPGITGISQITGRNLLCDEEKLRGDIYYLENLKMWLDIKIFFRTIFKVAEGEGVRTVEQRQRKIRK